MTAFRIANPADYGITNPKRRMHEFLQANGRWGACKGPKFCRECNREEETMGVKPTKMEYDMGTNKHGRTLTLIASSDGAFTLQCRSNSQRDDMPPQDIDLSADQLRMLGDIGRG